MIMMELMTRIKTHFTINEPFLIFSLFLIKHSKHSREFVEELHSLICDEHIYMWFRERKRRRAWKEKGLTKMWKT